MEFLTGLAVGIVVGFFGFYGGIRWATNSNRANENETHDRMDRLYNLQAENQAYLIQQAEATGRIADALAATTTSQKGEDHE